MMATDLEPALTTILAQAEALARSRGEETSTVHVLAMLGSPSGPTAEVLAERGARPRKVLDVAERLVPGPVDHLPLFASRVREYARRFGAGTPRAAHCLLVILNDTSLSAHRVLVELGVNIASARGAAVQAVQGLPMRRPARAMHDELRLPTKLAEPLASPRRRGKTGEAVSLLAGVGQTPVPRRKLASPVSSSPSAPSEPHPSAPAAPAQNPASSPASAVPFQPDAKAQTSKFALPKNRFPILTTIGTNLTELAEAGRLDPVYGRDEEIDQVLDVLAKRQANCPIVLGPPGVGKTSILHGVALRIAGAEDGSSTDERILIEIPLSELIAGTGVRGALASRLSLLKKEVEAAEGRVVLCFDEIHRLFSAEVADEIAADLKLSLARGELPCIGATSPEEYRKMVDRDAALERRLTPIRVDEPTREEAYPMLLSALPRLERHHKTAYDEEAVALAIAWSIRYLSGRALPDKALSILDLAGARASRRGQALVDSEAVAQVVASQAKMPIERLLESDAARMLRLEAIFAERVIGHEAELSRIARILRRNAAGLGSRRPIGTFLLLGPTGVGKTETAKAIASVMFHSESAMTRIDMAELSEAHAVAKLIGAPPGYVGHDAGGQLTEAVQKRPYQVILLDEIEKAHPEVLMAFLAVFDEGRMTDSRGRVCDFTNTVLVLTSNLGAQAAAQVQRKVGFRAANGSDKDERREAVIQAARRALPPELYNRIDEVLVFTSLERESVMKIARLMIQELAKEVFESRGIELGVDEPALEWILDQGGYDPELGARPLRRQLARLIEAPLAEAILEGRVAAGDAYEVTLAGGELRPKVTPGSRAAE
jgi:ATP-dependent Clp protease ATP-binding subunit ClpC